MRDLRFAIFRFNYITLEDIGFERHKGAFFRGRLGRELKRTVEREGCAGKQGYDCNNCISRAHCVFLWFFKTPGDSKKGFTEMPHPYLLLQPLDDKVKYPAGHRFSLVLTLFNGAIMHLGVFVAALRRIGDDFRDGKIRKCFFLESVENVSSPAGDDRTLVYHKGSLCRENTVHILSSLRIFHDQTLNTCPTCVVTFLTPLRLKSKTPGSRSDMILKAKDFDLGVFLRRINGRISLLSRFYGDTNEVKQDCPYDEVGRLNVVSHLYDREIKPIKTSMGEVLNLDGVMGSIILNGYIEPFIPFLRVGEYIHVGSRISYGHGKYVVSFIRS